MTIWLASSLYLEIIDSLNAVHGVSESRPIWKLRPLAIGLTLVQATILIAALVAIVAWPQIIGWLGIGSGPAFIATAIKWVVLFVMLLTSFVDRLLLRPRRRHPLGVDHAREPLRDAPLHRRDATASGLRPELRRLQQDLRVARGDRRRHVLVLDLGVILLVSAQMNRVIEDASPIGKKTGQKADPTDSIDLDHLDPEEAPDREEEQRAHR